MKKEDFMRVDMTPILTGKTDKIPFVFDYEDAAELFSEVSFDGPVHIDGVITERSGCMLLTLKASVSYTTECARCLKELHRSLTFDLSKNAAVSGSLEGDDNDDYVIVENSVLDLRDPVEELLFLELPSRDLCSDDCQGLCPKCGKDLNEGKCNCETKEIDPRLEVLKKFLQNNDDNN